VYRSVRFNRGTLVTAAMGLLAGSLYWYSEAPQWQTLVLFTNLYALALYDWHHFRLPNLLTATFFLSAALFVFVSPGLNITPHIVGAVIGLVFFPILNLFYKRLRGHDGIGMGDAKLLACIGLWLGWQSLPHVLLVASLTGLTYAAVCWASQITISKTTKLPFGTFLCLGTWLVWLFGDQI